ncbi:MAG: amino protease [Sphingomonas bacterium]|nr:amino protease [Sphingomonas bacterium]
MAAEIQTEPHRRETADALPDGAIGNAGATRADPPRWARGGGGAAVALLLSILIVWAAMLFLPGLASRVGSLPDAPLPLARAVETRAVLLASAGVVAGALLIAWLMRQRIALGMKRPGLIVAAFPAGALGIATALALSWAAGAATLVSDRAVVGGGAVLLLGALLVGWSALAEELMFRGVVQPLLQRAWGGAPAVVLSAAAFTVPHYLGGWRDPLSLLNIFGAAVWFGLLALRTGGVLAPWLAHIGWNGVEALLFGASPNPGIGAYGSWIDVDLAGAATLGGSAEGLNASLTVTLVLAALIAPLAAGMVRRTKGWPEWKRDDERQHLRIP